MVRIAERRSNSRMGDVMALSGEMKAYKPLSAGFARVKRRAHRFLGIGENRSGAFGAAQNVGPGEQIRDAGDARPIVRQPAAGPAIAARETFDEGCARSERSTHDVAEIHRRNAA